MDDSQGAMIPSTDRPVTVTFGDEGVATMQLDCNRGNASYTATATSASGGSLTFGPAAVTRALCPEPRIGEFLAGRLGDITSYTLRDGSLYLALQLDSGIFQFEPIE